MLFEVAELLVLRPAGRRMTPFVNVLACNVNSNNRRRRAVLCRLLGFFAVVFTSLFIFVYSEFQADGDGCETHHVALLDDLLSSQVDSPTECAAILGPYICAFNFRSTLFILRRENFAATSCLREYSYRLVVNFY